MFDEIWLIVRSPSDAKVCKSCRSRQELSNVLVLLAKCSVDTAENEPLKVCQNLPKVRK